MILAAAAFAPSTASGKPKAGDWRVLITITLIGDLPPFVDESFEEHPAAAVAMATEVTAAAATSERRYGFRSKWPLSAPRVKTFLIIEPPADVRYWVARRRRPKSPATPPLPGSAR
ncbi:hypothetical protein FRACA_10009 [Frankia canadensis]|uniref:Uncharacterized protein n=1 Tax=Frankia canadensis TaxID=1836972 RepID=A0A2I2KHV1_9ACTN|nr:hypothetical protein FRACA_10009 [Frankia canadensis]SOU52540.1 hypothetical protein FRACA_10009 [Frankia canadensis]